MLLADLQAPEHSPSFRREVRGQEVAGQVTSVSYSERPCTHNTRTLPSFSCTEQLPHAPNCLSLYSFIQAPTHSRILSTYINNCV